MRRYSCHRQLFLCRESFLCIRTRRDRVQQEGGLTSSIQATSPFIVTMNVNGKHTINSDTKGLEAYYFNHLLKRYLKRVVVNEKRNSTIFPLGQRLKRILSVMLT